MTEATRFMRYVLPGVAVFVQLWGVAWVASEADPRFGYEFNCMIDRMPCGWLGDSGFGAAVALVLVSGGAGYLMGAVYHLFIGMWVLTHRSVLESAMKDRALMLEGRGKGFEGEVGLVGSAKRLGRSGAWRLQDCAWFYSSAWSRVKLWDKAMARVDSMTSYVHAAGTTLVGVFVGGVVLLVLALAWRHGFWAIVASASVLLTIQGLSYVGLVKRCSRVREALLLDGIFAHPVTMTVFKDELKPKRKAQKGQGTQSQ